MPLGQKLNGTLRDFIERQPMFFVATAAKDGRVNVSPKGMDTLRIEDDTRIVWLNLSGSGNETAAHVQATGRMTLMFCAFEGYPKILRFQGQGEVLEPGHPEYDTLKGSFPDHPGARAIIRVHTHRISDSCGFGVPLMSYQGERSQLVASAERKGEDGLDEYRRRKNATSLDGLPGLDFSDP